MTAWPAMMRKQTALRYLDLSEAAFEREIAQGRLPVGVLFGGRPHWRKESLDKALAVIAGDMSPNHEDEFWSKYGGKAA